MLVEDDVSIVFRQSDNRRRDFIAGLHLVEEAVPLLVYENSAAAANRFGNQIRGLLLDGRVNLNFAHVHGAGADAFQQRDTAPGSPFVVSGDEAFKVRTILHDHRAVSAEAAGGHYDAFGLYFNDLFSSLIRRTPLTSSPRIRISSTEVSSRTSIPRLVMLRTGR